MSVLPPSPDDATAFRTPEDTPTAVQHGAPLQLTPGTVLGRSYQVIGAIGRGGMGEVYRARDTRLDRNVAIKIISRSMAQDPHWRTRFNREARAISALNHSHICTLYDVGQQDGMDFLVLEYLDGETLADRLRRGPLSATDAVHIATGVADALHEAHIHGLIHRDLKPANIFITSNGEPKILDFGLAKSSATERDDSVASRTADGGIVGTPAYMAPEQMRGLPMDGRTDLFSLGIVLYEMVTGERPFRGSSAIGLADAILHNPPRDFGKARIPARLKAIIFRLLEKDPSRRFSSANEVIAAFREIQPSRARHAYIYIAAVVSLALIGSVAWMWRRYSRERWALQTATPEIVRLLDRDKFVEAAMLTQQARAILPNDATLEKLWTRATAEPSITTDPNGAEVSIRPFTTDDDHWQSLGTTPLKNIRVPINEYMWRIRKAGFAPIEMAYPADLTWKFKLWPRSAVPDGMAVVSGGRTALPWPFSLAAMLRLNDFVIDRHEVTNEEYKKFVDAGGYQRPEFWTEPFTRNGRTLSWQEAMASFHDSTDAPGPATWEVGSFPHRHENYPVNGVSWFEAAAYARFAGKSLPTVYHWTRAAQTWAAPLVVSKSNFSNDHSVPVGHAPSGFGTTDMAGNVKEWCLNESTADKRFILGGGFGEATYMFNMLDARSPWERNPNDGFRCVKLFAVPPAATAAKLDLPSRDVWKDEIVSGPVFAAYKELYAYDRRDIHARIEDTRTSPIATRLKITFDTAYGNERMAAYLFLPTNASPPYQTLIYFPTAGALLNDHFDEKVWADEDRDFLIQSGRALMVPIYKGFYDRHDDIKPGGPDGDAPAVWRDHVIMWSKDVGRSIDYLATRNDIDQARIGYYGYSLGGAIAPVMLAVEPRLKAAVLSSAGQWYRRAMPEVDVTNFAPRVHIPVLMLNGRYDSRFPVETSQLPMFRRLGTPEADKRYVVYDAGHAALPHAEEVRETLRWFDRYLGPIQH